MGPKVKQVRIALIGKSGSGKSEVASYLSGKYGCEIVKTGAICRSISMILFGNDEKASTQLLDDALTTIDPSIFLRAGLRSVGAGGPVVVDALRFLDDLQLAKSLDFQTLRVTADSGLRLERLTARGQAFDLGTQGLHRSEVDLDAVRTDFSITNNGSLADLYTALDAMLVA